MYKPDFRTRNNGVPILSKRDIETIGENFVRDFKPQALLDPQPLDVDRFAEFHMGLTIDYQFLSHCGVFLGMLVFNDTDKLVIYDAESGRAEYIHADARTVIIDNTLLEGNQEHRYRYTMGHEIGHDVFHSRYYAYNPDQMSMFDPTFERPMFKCRAVQPKSSNKRLWTDVDWMEWQANYFSSVLLMPATAVYALWKGYVLKKGDAMGAYLMITKTATTFNVSTEVAMYRLEALGLLKKGIWANEFSLQDLAI